MATPRSQAVAAILEHPNVEQALRALQHEMGGDDMGVAQIDARLAEQFSTELGEEIPAGSFICRDPGHTKAAIVTLDGRVLTEAESLKGIAQEFEAAHEFDDRNPSDG